MLAMVFTYGLYVKCSMMGTTTPDKLVVRGATAADVSIVARLDHQATLPPLGHSFYDDLLKPTGTDTLTFLEAVFRHNANSFGSVEDFILLELNGTVAAGCAVYKPNPAETDAGPLKLEALPNVAEALGWKHEQTEAFLTACKQIWEGPTDFLVPQAEMIIEAVAVLPEFRGCGLGHRLMEAAKERAKQLGARTLGVMVIHGNDAAEHLYRQHFQPYISFHADYFDGEFPGITKFRTKLFS